MQYLILFILTTNLSFASCTFVVNLMEKCPSKAQIAAMEYQKKFFADLAAKKAAEAKLAAIKKTAKKDIPTTKVAAINKPKLGKVQNVKVRT